MMHQPWLLVIEKHDLNYFDESLMCPINRPIEDYEDRWVLRVNESDMALSNLGPFPWWRGQ